MTKVRKLASINMVDLYLTPKAHWNDNTLAEVYTLNSVQLFLVTFASQFMTWSLLTTFNLILCLLPANIQQLELTSINIYLAFFVSLYHLPSGVDYEE